MKTYFSFLVLAALAFCSLSLERGHGKTPVVKGRDGKLLPVFQVIRFPNDPCFVSGGTKNGTCYTAEECSNKGGDNIGSCAEGFGVCCTFTLGCGSSSNENCTYFDSATTVVDGACSAKICKLNSNICQIRLDFNTFVISGPSTAATTVGKFSAGAPAYGGKEFVTIGQCLTDTFGISNQNTIQTICGTNTGYHAYFDASDTCNDLSFALGNTARGLTAVATRSWSIKVTQYTCDSINRAPQGCSQYHFGSTSGLVQSFNYQAGTKHLADQQQVVCVRRENNMCRICWAAVAGTSVDVSNTAAGTMTAHEKCCSYGDTGMKGGATVGWDCLVIPGALKKTDNVVIKVGKFCGKSFALVSAAATAAADAKTICSKELPFRVHFYSDGYELATEAGKGFQLSYTMTSC